MFYLMVMQIPQLRFPWEAFSEDQEDGVFTTPLMDFFSQPFDTGRYL